VNIKQSIVLRVRVVFILIALGSVAIPYRIAKLQLNEGDKWRAKAEITNFQYREIPATRGNIYAENGSLLATSLPFYKVAMDPTVIKSELYEKGIDSLALMLSSFYEDKSAAAYKRMISDSRLEGKRYLVLNRKQINYQEMQKLVKWPIFRAGRSAGGVIFEKVEKRYRPFSSLASRTVGYLTEESNGAGIEYSFNNYLSGKNGKALFQRLAGGTWKPVVDAEGLKPEDGFDVLTTLDVNIQDVAETALRRQLTDREAAFGSVIVMEVATGQIKAITNLQRNASGNGYSESYNYAIANEGNREPGSTFKLFSMLALLEENKISLDQLVDTGNGVYRFYDRNMRDAKNGGYGKITIREAFEKSSNVGISRLVDEHFGSNPSKFMEYLDQVGLKDPLGFQLTGEGKPYYKKPGSKNWYGTSLPWISIGYESTLNPIHTLAFYNAVANDGVMVKPYIVKTIAKGNIVEKKYETQVIRQRIASEKTIKALQELLEGVVSNGTAKNIANADYKIAGKTGTAQKLINNTYTQIYYTSFAGYFPADNPKYSMIVVIDSPTGLAAYGGDVSAPVFKEIADRIYALDLDLNPINQTKLAVAEASSQKPSYLPAGNTEELQQILQKLGLKYAPTQSEDWVKPVFSEQGINWQANDIDRKTIPDVAGLSLKDALFILENKGLKVNYSGKGRVQIQSVTPGSAVIPNSTITLVLG
jgi:cell division protein FtsI (penicillin-binding protein 3)